MKFDELKEFLDLKANHYQSQDFISADPIQIPHRFTNPFPVEVMAYPRSMGFYKIYPKLIRHPKYC